MEIQESTVIITLLERKWPEALYSYKLWCDSWQLLMLSGNNEHNGLDQRSGGSLLERRPEIMLTKRDDYILIFSS